MVEMVDICVTTDRRQFILFYLLYFSLFFFVVLFLFAYLRFGSHFRSHDSHVTGKHMVELGAIFLLLFFLQEQTVLQRTRTRTLYT